MDSRLASEMASVSDLFEMFIMASTMKNVLSLHHRILNYADLSPCEFNQFYPKFKSAVMTNRTKLSWKAKALFSKLDKKAAHKCYSNTKVSTPLGSRPKSHHASPQVVSQDNRDSSLASNRSVPGNDALQHFNCLVIGSGPAGLRTAIELQLLGASKVVIVEKRSRFSRNNVLHLWPFVIHDLKSLGAKKFFGKFCAGSIDHISIRQIQLILLKVSLILGCDFRDSCSYLHLCPDTIKLSSPVVQKDGLADGAGGIQVIKCDHLEKEESNPLEFKKVSDSIASQDDKEPQAERSNSSAENGTYDNTGQDNLPGGNKAPQISVGPVSTDTQRETDSSTRYGRLQGARAHFQSEYKVQEKELHGYEWDIIIGADGRRNTLSKYFPRKEFRGRLAIAITANFINHQTPAESAVSEISGLSYIYNQELFQALAVDTNIHLENICYYKDDTHYFVMTAKKHSLLERGVLINDYPATQDLLSEKNVNRQALLDYARDAALWTTSLNPLDFALNHYGQEDCAMFDFTSMYAAVNACKALRTNKGGLSLISLVGDSLLEPFWPTGSGCARGFLSSLDAAWMCRQWAVNRCPILDQHDQSTSRQSRSRLYVNDSLSSDPVTTYDRMALSVMAERESIYRILAQTTSENLQQTYSHWTLNPHTRYPNLNRHLVLPSQIEHLISCSDLRASPIYKTEHGSGYRNKSPRNQRIKSPKKLKSANASPQSNRKQPINRMKFGYKSKSRNDIDTFLEFERSYDNLNNLTRYRADLYCEDDLSNPSISGISPSANNLLSLEVKRSRDIDECLRLRRQRNQLSVVKDRLKQQFNVGEVGGECEGKGNAAILNELRRFREQKLLKGAGKENNGQLETRPLTILNSIRRCASFAERVKSFENRTVSVERDSTPVMPRTPIDNVKNLPEFVTLQELFQSNGRESEEAANKKPKMPIMKLSKEDWNVKCWEKRLSAYKQRQSLTSSTRSLNKALSIDSHIIESGKSVANKCEKQIQVFKDRIREMADKLDKPADERSKVEQVKKQFTKLDNRREMGSLTREPRSTRAGSWVSHLRSELIRSSDTTKQVSNPFAPRQTIKKLFQDDTNGNGDNDMDKHFDHLCLNKPKNKYLQRNAYTSHLARSKIDMNTARVLNRSPATASRAAFLEAFSSSKQPVSSENCQVQSCFEGLQCEPPTTDCFRCKKSLNLGEQITIGGVDLHRACLMCASCGITLRTNEIRHHLDRSSDEQASEFVCSICKPSMRDELSKQTSERAFWGQPDAASDRLRSREEFLSQRIDYGELYKNIIVGEIAKNTLDGKCESGVETIHNEVLSPSPIKFTLPLEKVQSSGHGRIQDTFRVVGSGVQTIDGSEHVTLVLPSKSPAIDGNTDAKQMMDEEELNRILHLDSSTTKCSPRDDDEDDDGDEEDADDDDGDDDDEEEEEDKEDEDDSAKDESSCETNRSDDEGAEEGETVQHEESRETKKASKSSVSSSFNSYSKLETNSD